MLRGPAFCPAIFHVSSSESLCTEAKFLGNIKGRNLPSEEETLVLRSRKSVGALGHCLAYWGGSLGRAKGHCAQLKVH
jgi:hypothetical protein